MSFGVFCLDLLTFLFPLSAMASNLLAMASSEFLPCFPLGVLFHFLDLPFFLPPFVKKPAFRGHVTTSIWMYFVHYVILLAHFVRLGSRPMPPFSSCGCCFAEVLSSNLMRAIETAYLQFGHRPVTLVDWMIAGGIPISVAPRV